MANWLVIGGAPGTDKPAKKMLAQGWHDKVIGCNQCLEWGILPDVYWISDPVAKLRYKAHWMKFKGEIIHNGELEVPTTPFPYVDMPIEFHGRCSGVLCCRVAIARGATALRLVGFLGYDPGDQWCDHLGVPRTTRGAQALEINKAQEVAFADIAKHYPDLKVTVFGKTRLKLPTTWERA